MNFGGCGGWGDGGFTPAGHKLRLHRPHSKKAEAHRGMVNSLLANATCHRHVAPKARCAKACGPWSSFRIHHPNKRNSEPSLKAQLAIWWGMVDSNHRRHRQQIYSLSPLATREIPHMIFTSVGAWLELVDGLEPPTC